jgi:hypothetical protein
VTASTLAREPVQKRARRTYIRGHARNALIHDLADRQQTYAQIAEKYGISEEAVRQHAHYHRAVIAEKSAEINDRVTGVWATEKISRMALLTHQVEEIQDHMDALVEEAERATEEMRKQFGPDAARVRVDYKEWCRYVDLQVKILHEIAEQMGQIPARVPAPGSSAITLQHVVAGVDMSKALGLSPTQSAVGSSGPGVDILTMASTSTKHR